METDYAFEMATSNIRYGQGTTKELGMDLADMGIKKVMVLSDPVLSTMAPVKTVLDSLAEQNVDYTLFDQVRVEPTDSSLKEAIKFTQDKR